MKLSIIFKRLSKELCKNKFMAVCLLFLMLLPLSGCSKKASNETLLIAGSSTMLPYVKTLEVTFKKVNPNILIDSEGGGSTAGLIAVKRKAIDLATMSSEIPRGEDDKYTRDYLVAKDAVIIAVHPSNPVTNLTKDQLYKIFTGTITNWQQVGGDSLPIVIAGRKVGSTTRRGIDEMVMSGLDFPKDAVKLDAADGVVKMVAETKGAIGYLALKDLKNSVRALSINNVPPSRETILTQRYPLSRSFYLVMYASPKDSAQKFVDFVMSNEGQTILEHEGLIRVY